MRTRVLVAAAGLAVASCRGGAPEASSSGAAATKWDEEVW